MPGAVGGWQLALELAKAHGGKLPLDLLLAPAIASARTGYTVTRSQARLTEEKMPEMKNAPGFATTFLIDGKPPKSGITMMQGAFAATLDHLSKAGLEDFYRGDVGREIGTDLEKIGSPVTRADLEKFKAYVAEPLSVEIGAGTLYNSPPPTQGLGVADDPCAVRPAESVQGGRFRFHPRSRRDPPSVPSACATGLSPIRTGSKQPLDRFLDAKISRRRSARRSTARRPRAGRQKWGEGDTVWMGAADSSGLVVSYIQSIFWEFGSGCVLPRTGLLMQNRGASFSLEKNAANPLEPGRLPFHTLNPALAVLKDGRVMAYGTMGGDGQPQTQAMLFSRYALFGQPLPEAVDAPRWLLGKTWGSSHTNLRLESAVRRPSD